MFATADPYAVAEGLATSVSGSPRSATDAVAPEARVPDSSRAEISVGGSGATVS